jgi:hypothetical protein
MAKLQRQGEVLRVRTVLCSTMCTQNSTSFHTYNIRLVLNLSISCVAVLAQMGKLRWRFGRAYEQIYFCRPGKTSLLSDELQSYVNFREKSSSLSKKYLTLCSRYWTRIKSQTMNLSITPLSLPPACWWTRGHPTRILGKYFRPLLAFLTFCCRPVLDAYILNHLKSIRAHTHLISCLKAIFVNMQTQSSKTLMPTLKVQGYQKRILFSYIICSL